MITIAPQDIEGMYVRLRAPRAEKQNIELLESLLKEIPPIETKKSIGVRSMQPQEHSTSEVSLPAPFKEFRVWFNSDGQVYSGHMRFVLNYDVFRQKSESLPIFDRLNETLKQRKDTYKTATGFYFLNGGDPYFTLVTDDLAHRMLLSFGKAGTVKRTLHSLEAFETDISALGRLATDILNAAYEQEPQDITLRFYI